MRAFGAIQNRPGHPGRDGWHHAARAINFFMNRFRKLGYIHYNGGLVVHDELAKALKD